MNVRCIFLSILLLLTGCVKGIAPVEVSPGPTSPVVVGGEIGWPADDLDRESLIKALEKSLLYYDSLSEERLLPWGDERIPVHDLKETLLAFREILLSDEPVELRDRKIAETFEFKRAAGMDGQGTVLVTGYYEPVLQGSLVMTDRYRFPLYGVPDDLLAFVPEGLTRGDGEPVGRWERDALVPYYSRADIDEGRVLEGRRLEIAWVDDPVERFYLHMQGSGRIRLEDGTEVRIGYAASNGLPFRSITIYLLEQGKITRTEAGYRAFKGYLRGLGLEELLRLFSYNERYVFFRLRTDGPLGSLRVPLTPGRSIATDAAVFPEGALAYMSMQLPEFDEAGKVVSWGPLRRFVLSQDAGNAIRGPGRVDLFCGSGIEQERLAGSLKQKGVLYLLLKKGSSAR
ncbi:MAG: MltA domain-containing protein [Deltaproteobacteria bacterium]|nr:MltA domain-containing protein [Deltaproteobacteria bacterium]